MTGTHYLPLVLASGLVAVLASYTALDLSGRVSAARGVGRKLWLVGGSVAMGVGIWSMHFIAMLAFHLPIPIRYDVPLWLASVAIAIVASFLALTVVSRPAPRLRSLSGAAPLMGLAIAGMHYTGMAAMRVPAETRYDVPLVVASIVIAVVASFGALSLAVHFREDKGRRGSAGKGLSAVVMGLAICGMHYTGMMAVSFHGTHAVPTYAGRDFLATRGLAITVTFGSLLILALALIGARIDRGIRRKLAESAESADAILRAEIRERLQVQERLRESKESYRSLFDSLTELVFVLDLQGRFLDVNDAVERTYGYSRFELVGAAPTLLTEATVSPDLVRERLLAAAGGNPQQFESIGVGKDGRAFPIEVVLSAATYFGEPVVLAVARDITDRKRAELELAAAEAHYRRLVETSPFGIFTLDEVGEVRALNSAAERIFSPAEVIGASFAGLLDPDDQLSFRHALERLRCDDRPSVEIEVRTRPLVGEPRLLALTLTEVCEADVPPTVHGIARDITIERQQQQQLRRAERLAGVGTLVGGVAHELNNPLTAIQSFAELMLMDERSEEDREGLETMRREASRAARIVSDLRLLARGTQSGGEQVRVGVDLNDVVHHVLKLRGYVFATRNVDVRVELDPALPQLLGDRGQIEQVVLNLVVNASQAMESTELRRLLLRTRRAGRSVVLEVGDTGTGIDPADMERIFDPFWTTKEPGEGTGLGLSLVHSIVTDHSGSIRVQSRRGKGTRFIITFPAVQQAGEPGGEAARRRQVAPPARRLRVLLVEDEAGIRRVLQHYLKRRGHEVEVAADGEEALEVLSSAVLAQPHDVIVSDLRMPGLSGDRFLVELRRRGDGLDQKVVFISGDAVDAGTARLLEEADVPILYKPFELEEFSHLVETFAEGQMGPEEDPEPASVGIA